MKVERLLIVSSLALGLGCGSDRRPAIAAGGSTAEPPTSGVSGESPAPEGTFGKSDCRTCLGEACAANEADCTSEPACADYLACLDNCPAEARALPDGDCAANCELPEALAVKALALHVLDCRDRGYGAACGCVQGHTTLPIFQQVCEPSTADNQCKHCEEERCCDTRTACTSDPECVAFLDCANACPSASRAACKVDCSDQHPRGYEKYTDRLACTAVRCSKPDECGNEPDPCVVCGDERCFDEQIACLVDVGCQKALSCGVACDQGTCPAGCAELDPLGSALLDVFLSCSTARCTSECASPND
jgi:hypothetical protein